MSYRYSVFPELFTQCCEDDDDDDDDDKISTRLSLYTIDVCCVCVGYELHSTVFVKNSELLFSNLYCE